MKKLLIFLSSIVSLNAMAYESEMYEDIKKINSDKIVIDVISHDPDNKDRHFNFINKVSKDFPNKKFRLAIHGDATFYALKNEKFENQKEKLKNNHSKYKLDFDKNNFNILEGLKNVDLYLCKAGAEKRLLDLKDVYEKFNTNYTSSQINAESQRDGFYLLKEESYFNYNLKGVKDLKKKITTFKIDESKLDIKIPKTIKHSFDIGNTKQFFTVARFVDMHLEAGVKPEDIDVAIVIHGNAVESLLKSKVDKNLDLLLKTRLVDVYVCGQNLSKRNYSKDMLKDDIKVSLSAMTAHHYLQKNGYSYNPF